MGKAALLVAATFTIVSAFYAANVQNGRLAMDERVAEHQYDVLARNAALLAYERAKQQLVDDFSNETGSNGSTEHAAYAASISSSGVSRKKISASGTVTSPRGAVTKKIFAVVEQRLVPGDLPDEAPEYLDYTLLTEDNLTLQGNIDVAVYAAGDSENQLNSNMHTNGNLHVNGNRSSVQGFGTYVGSATSNPNRALVNTFRPNYNPASASVAQQVSYIDIPDFDMATFAANVSIDQTTTGDVTLSGDIDLGGTREDPYIWHVTGNVTSTGGTTVDGYVIFLVEGNLTVNGNTRIGDSGYDESSESSIGFYVDGDISLAGSTVTDAQLYATGDVTFNGTSTIYGTVTSQGGAVISGTPNLYYRRASPGLSTPFEPPPTVIEYALVSYGEK